MQFLLKAPFKNMVEFRDIFREYFNPLVNLVYLYHIHDYEVAKEIVYQTFAETFEKKDEITSDIKSHLFQNVKNSAMEYISIHPDLDSIVSMEKGLEVSEYKSIEEEANAIIIRSEIVKGIKMLNPQMKLIFELHQLKGYPYEKIASELKLSIRKVENNMARAFGIIGDKLKESSFFTHSNAD